MNGSAKCRKDGGKETFPHQFSLSLLALSSFARHEWNDKFEQGILFYMITILKFLQYQFSWVFNCVRKCLK